MMMKMKETKEKQEKLKKDALEAFNKAQEEFKKTEYEQCRYSLNGVLNDILLSKNARLFLESAYIPTITNLNNYINVRIVTNAQDTILDTLKYISG